MKRANVILTPRQKKVIEFKLKQAKQKRMVKSIIYNNDLSADTKIAMVRNILI
jgi:hypothetical protein